MSSMNSRLDTKDDRKRKLTHRLFASEEKDPAKGKKVKDFPDSGFHPYSNWQEPWQPDATYVSGDLTDKTLTTQCLTMYEIHRKPRLLASLWPTAKNQRVPEESPGKAGKTERAALELSDPMKKSDSEKTTSEPKITLSGDQETNEEQHGPIRVTRDVKQLLDTFRCVICCGTLNEAKIVRDCLHRFCENCVETCLRRFKTNQCPVCRKEIPTRRNLTKDLVYNTLIDSLELRKFDQDSNDGVPSQYDDETGGDGVQSQGATVSAMLQKAIARKQEHLLQMRKAAGALGNSLTDVQEDITSGFVELLLKPCPNEHPHMMLPEMELSYIRLSGEATISLVESFLKQKFLQDFDMDVEHIYLSQTQERGILLGKKMLRDLSKPLHNGVHPPPTVLYYRQSKII